MRFQNGMLGLCISVLAVMGMVLSGFALSVDVQDRQVVTYEYMTDISGLFDYTQEPTFIDYNPASNWTGFTEPGGDVTGGIDYTIQQNANSYPVVQQPTEVSSSDQDLETLNLAQVDPPVDTGRGTMGPFWGIMWDTNAHFPTPNESTDSDYPRDYSPYPYVATLATLANAVAAEGSSRMVITLGTADDSPVVAPVSGWSYERIRSTVTGMENRYWDTYTLNLSSSERVSSVEINLESGVTTGYSASGAVLWSGQSSANLCIIYGFVESSTSGSGIQDQQLTSTVTITQYDDPTPIYMDISAGVSIDGAADWTNGYDNGRIDILFRLPSSGTQFDNTIDIPLSDLSGTATGESITVEVSADGDGNIKGVASHSSGISDTISLGTWRNFILSLDPEHGIYSMIPVTDFVSFTTFTVLENSEQVFDLNLPGRQTIHDLEFTSQSSMLLGVVSTATGLGTTTPVMVDPSLDVSDYFTDLTDLRVNFFSFAVYGESITVNGTTFAVNDDAQVFVPVSSPDGSVTSRLLTLSNLYITFEGSNTYLTFVNDDAVVDLGETTTTEISMSGIWYFTTGLYRGSSTTETFYDWNFDDFAFTSNGAIMAFLGILCIGTIVGTRVVRGGMGALDYIVVVFAAICALTLVVV